MTRTIPLMIQNEYIVGDKVPIGASGSHNDIVLRMEFSPMWDGLTKTAQFGDALGGTPVEVILTADLLADNSTNVYLVPVPHGAKKYPGKMTLAIKGATVRQNLELRATMAAFGTFTVTDSKWDDRAEQEQDVTPTQAEQLQGQIDYVLETISDARSAATEAAESASSAASSASIATNSAAAAAESATNAASSKAAAEESAAAAAESIKHAPRISSDGKWELWDTATSAYVTTEYTAIGEDGSRGLGWYRYNVAATIAQAVVWSASISAPKWGKGDWLFNPDNGNVGLCTSRTDKADGSGSANITYKGTLKGTDGVTPHIGDNGDWYIGDTDTGVQAAGSSVVYVDVSGTDTITANKTFAEIKAAYENGDTVVARLGGNALLPLSTISSVSATFKLASGSNYWGLTCSNNGAPGADDLWSQDTGLLLNKGTVYTDIGRKTVLEAIKELQAAPAVDIATSTEAGIVKPSSDFDIAADGTLSLYKAMEVTAWEYNGTTYSTKYKDYEKGAKVTGISLGWALNKEPAQQLLSAFYDDTSTDIDDMDIGTAARGTDELTGDALTRWAAFSNREFTIIGFAGVGFILKAVDGRGASNTRSFVLNGFNGVYTGAAAAPTAIDSAFIQTLGKSIQSGKSITFTADAEDGQYIWYACPTWYDTPSFKVGGFDGGFSQVATLDYTNPSDYTESYQVWRSDNAGLGSTTVVVS